MSKEHYIKENYPFLNSFSWAALIIWKPPHENNQCHEFKKQVVLSKASLYFITVDVYQRSNDSSDHELWLAKTIFTVSLIQYESLSILNKMVSRQYFLRKMRRKSYLIFMVTSYIF